MFTLTTAMKDEPRKRDRSGLEEFWRNEEGRDEVVKKIVKTRDDRLE